MQLLVATEQHHLLPPFPQLAVVGVVPVRWQAEQTVEVVAVLDALQQQAQELSAKAIMGALALELLVWAPAAQVVVVVLGP
jgi:hypothetical protein